MSRLIIPPIKCQGIKTKILRWILQNVIHDESHVWVEPFMGSGVVGFNASPKKAIFSDTNPHIIKFYNSIQNGKITLHKLREFHEREGALLQQLGESHYYHVRNRFNLKGDPLDFLFLSRACFNGMIRFNKKGHFNVPFCRKPNRFSKSYITKICNQVKDISSLNRFKDWSFECGDFRKQIASAKENDFIYCDPPYAGRHADYFNKWTEEDENDLCHYLKNTKARFMLSTWHSNQFRHNPSIEKYWKDFYVITQEHFYHLGGREENRNPVLEALVMNYVPPIQIQRAKSTDTLRQNLLFEKKSKYL